MKNWVGILVFTACSWVSAFAQDTLIYHEVRTDKDGFILPWFSPDPAKSYDHVIHLVWNFWDHMRSDANGLPYYMNHQVWRPDFNDPRGLGGDQLQMAMSSWRLLYAYSGNERVKQNIKFMADYYLSHSLSPANSMWPNLPFPYNTLLYSGVYDGDMVIGQGFLQPDKAGSLGLELLHLYKMSAQDFYLQSTADRYLQASRAIARTLAERMTPGDENSSPLPFKVNALTGEVGPYSNTNPGAGFATYTTNWVSTMELFLELQEIDPQYAEVYERAFLTLLDWMKKYPLVNHRWGPFFEDVQSWSDTQINAVTFARFMMEHPKYFPDWRLQVPEIFAWVYKTLGNNEWQKYGVTVVNEQTVYHTPGQSHVARQGATELLYASLSGDESRKAHAIRQLNWATYMVDHDGKNRFPRDENWLTDGYGDYVRHYIWAMAAYPELAPSDRDRIISSTSVIQQADYRGNINKFLVPYVIVDDIKKVRVYYRAFDDHGTEVLRLEREPSSVLLNGVAMTSGYAWQPLVEGGGVLKISRRQGREIIVLD